MIFVAKNADFSAKNIGKVNVVYDDTEGDDGVTVLVSSIQIKPVTETLVVGDKVQLKTIVFPLNAYMRNDLKWSVNDTKKAIVSDTGLLTILDEGEVVVTAEAKDGSEVSTSTTLTLNGRSLDDVMAETYTILQYYQSLENRTYTNKQIIALDTFLSRIGIQYQESVWNKIQFMMIPCLGSSANNMFVNMKNGFDTMTKATCDRSIFTLEDGWLRNKSGLKDQSIPCYVSYENKKMLYVNDGFFYMYCGTKTNITGGGSTWTEYNNIIYDPVRLGFSQRTGEQFYAETEEPCFVRGGSSDNTLEGTSLYPNDKPRTEYFSGFDGYLARVNATQKSINSQTFRLNSNISCVSAYIYGNYLTEDELNSLGDSLTKFLTDFGVDITQYPD